MLFRSLTVAGAMATNTANAGTVAAAFPATAPAIIDIAALLGVTPPVLGAAPASTITPTAQYTGSVSWTPTAGSFGAATVYTAHVVLAAKAGWTLNAVTADFFTVAGSSSSTNPADSGAVTAAFPATAAANILAAGVTGFVAPVTGVTNQLVGSLTRGAVSYSVTSLTWSPTTTPYTQGTAYTATVVLSSAAGYKFPSAGIAQPTATAGGGTVSAGTTTGGDVSGNALSFTVAFPATISDAAVVAAAKAALAIGYGSGDSAASVTQNLSLPASGSGGSTVTWGETSDTGGNLAIAGGTGTITRPAYTLGNGSATLRATITKGAASDTKDFTLTILAHAGTVADPYEICTLAQLVTMRDNINGADAGANAWAYKLMADIDIGSFNTGIGWVPIGNLAVKFTGDFHGNGKTISNLYINEAAADYKGLFGYFGGTAVGLSKIHDLTLTSVNVTGNMRTAGLAGVADSYFGYITNCSVTSGTVSGAVYAVGGLVGYNSTNTVTNCSAAVAVTLRSGNSAGGLVGSNFYHGYIYGSHATGTVQGTSANQLGGLVGSNSNYGPLTTCFATGSVTGFYAVGGLVGVLEGKSTAAGLTDCYATGAVSATYTTSGRAGGLVGYTYGSGIEVVLANCYATGAVTAGTNNGGLVGYVMSGTTTATRSFYDTNTTGMTAANEAHGTATTTANMKVQATFAGWNYSTIWNIGAGVNNGYPYLR